MLSMNKLGGKPDTQVILDFWSPRPKKNIQNSIWEIENTYEEISWATTFFCWKWQNWDFAIAIIFYPAIRTLWKFLCILFGCGSTQILNFNAKKNFAKILKIVRKSGFYPIFGHFLKFLKIFFCIEIQNLSATRAK